MSANNQSILVIDNDEPIRYQKTKIDNSKIFIPSLDDLNDLFNDDKESIFSCNTKNVLTAILNDNSEISLHEYNGQDVMFLKISTPELIDNDSEILICPHCQCSDSHISIFNVPNNNFDLNCFNIPVIWSLMEEKMPEIIQKAMNDFNGYLNTESFRKSNINITRSSTNLNNIPAIKYCIEKVYQLKDTVYKGYVPAVGQLLIIKKYKKMIECIIGHFGFVANLKMYEAWSSTTYNNKLQIGYILDGKGKLYLENQSQDLNVLPLFKKVN